MGALPQIVIADRNYPENKENKGCKLFGNIFRNYFDKVIIMFSDEQLAKQLQQGDEAALETLVHRYHGQIHAYLVRMGGEYHLAADIVQEVFIKVCRYIHTYQPELSFRTWIYTIASNTYKDYLKRSYVQREVLGVEMGDNAAAAMDTPEAAVISNAQREAVLQMIGRLGGIYREVLVLRYFQDLKLEEISLVLKVPLGTVKSRLRAALHHLRRIHAKEGVSNANR